LHTITNTVFLFHCLLRIRLFHVLHWIML
jgi:hypothetical protein